MGTEAAPKRTDRKRSSDSSRKPPSFAKIFGSDYATTLSVIGFVVLWGMYLVFGLLAVPLYRHGHQINNSGGDSHTFLKIALSATALCVPIAVYRVRKIQEHFRKGRDVLGRVLSIDLWKDRGTISFEYEIEGSTYRGSRAIHKNKRVTELNADDPITVTYDPRNLRSAFVRDLFE